MGDGHLAESAAEQRTDTTFDPGLTQRYTKVLKRVINKDGQFNVRRVGRTWQATADERSAYTDLLVDQLKALSAHAADHGVVLGVEPLNRFETSVLNLTADAIAIVDRVGSPACGLMLDTFHMNIEESSIGAALRAAGPRLKHLHACENDRGAPGSGHVPWTEVAEALRDISYDGGVVIESFTSQVKSIARAAAIWRPLAATQDALAGNGLTHLRALLR